MIEAIYKYENKDKEMNSRNEFPKIAQHYGKN